MLELRQSLDRPLNSRGRTINSFMCENALTLPNGRTPSDFSGQFTFIGRLQNSVVDLAWISDSSLDLIDDLVLLNDFTPSNHFAIFVSLRIGNNLPKTPVERMLKSLTANTLLKWSRLRF